MYKSTHIKHSNYSDFGLKSRIGSRLLSDDPGTIINRFQEAGKLKNKLSRPISNPNLSQRLDGLVDDAGAATAVLGTAIGGGIKKYGGTRLAKTGEKVKQWGINTVMDDTRRGNLGRSIVGGAGLAGGSLLAAGGIVGAAKLSDKLSGIPDPEEYDEYPMYTSYRKATWRTVDFYR